MNRIICGVDVSKQWLDAHVLPGGVAARFGNDGEGIADLFAFCRTHQVELVAMEASGGYEQMPFLLLWEMGQSCALANARQVRHLAEGLGFLEKTDRIDALIIARFAG